MNRNLLLVVLVGGALLSRCFGDSARNAASDTLDRPLLQIHLPREVTVQSSLLTLGEISIVRGAGALAARAGTIGLGRLSVPGQKVTVDRTTILSRLASQGIPGDRVRLTGAQSVAVQRQQQIIDSDEFIALAQMFLKQNPPARSVSESIAVSRPQDLILPGETGNIRVIPGFVRSGARGFVTVRISVAVDGKTVGSRDIPFRLRYQCRKVVAAREIAKGAILTPENVKVEAIVADRPEPADWRPPYGLVALRDVQTNVEIRADMIGAPESDVSIRRNETVVIRLERPGLLISAVGIALQQASAGEYVKVRNTDSNRVIVCRVNADGTVQPVL
ncbi:MAG: flagellar basal body P-ring formation protein FlgA [Sedimentisphaerales bacterium]|nr:flagellar basal body P-ring formation protein FlgA [Sedimentisphaerales bacterium]